MFNNAVGMIRMMKHLKDFKEAHMALETPIHIVIHDFFVCNYVIGFISLKAVISNTTHLLLGLETTTVSTRIY